MAPGDEAVVGSCTRASANWEDPLGLASPSRSCKRCGESGNRRGPEGGGSQVSESHFLPVRWPGQTLLTAEEQRIAPESAFIHRNMLPETGLRCMR